MYNRNISENRQLQNALPLIGNQNGFGKIQTGFFNSKRQKNYNHVYESEPVAKQGFHPKGVLLQTS